ncbi:MAG: response regulator [Rhizobacter sp.]|nr:response regulator [Chlorobiales bacterium]
MIVVIDDEPSILEMLKIAFSQRFGDAYQIETFSNGASAVRFIQGHKGLVEVCIVDYAMPVQNGDTVARQIKSIDKNIFMIMMSGFVDFRIAEPLLKERLIYQFFNKPINLGRLCDATDTAIQLYMKRQAL